MTSLLPRRTLGATALLTLLLVTALAGCAAAPSPDPLETEGDPAAEETTGDADAGDDSGAACELVDADDIFTPAFFDIYVNDNGWNQENSRAAFIERRCAVPDDATVIQLFRDNGVQLDGISTGSGSIFYLGTGAGCLVQVAYYPADGNWSHEHSDDAGAARVATPAEVVQHELASC